MLTPNTQNIEYHQDSQLLSLFEVDSQEHNIAQQNLEKLKKKHIVIIGVGGVGSVCAQTLVRSGILNISLVDGDIVEKSNLGRQYYNYEDISRPKVEALKRQLIQIQPNCNIKTRFEFINENTVNEILEDCDIVIDCSDNLKTRRIINNFCYTHNIFWIYSGAQGFECTLCLFDYSVFSNSEKVDKSNNKNKSKVLEKKDFFSKLITPQHRELANCSTGVLTGSTSIAAQLIISELFMYCVFENTSFQKKNFEGKKLHLLNSHLLRFQL
ncbi:MAG: HesA/MoeB/ThiF family protein [Candidatus Nanoarchaeia archaeon]